VTVRFAFTSEQRMFQESFREFLQSECPPDSLCALWESDTGRSPERWQKLAELGVLGVLAPEDTGGLGLSEVDLVLLLEEAGAVALPEPLVETAAVAVPLLRELDAPELAEKWLRAAAAGEAVLTVGHPDLRCVADAHVADLLLLPHSGALHAVPRRETELTHQPTSDGTTRWHRVDWSPGADTRVAQGDAARALLDAAFDRGALGYAAQQLGVAQKLVTLAVDYAKERQQFGKPIGSFQAVKHALANVQVRIEFARPVVYRAAYSVAQGGAQRSAEVSQAKVAASDAALLAARASLQVHGAIGYTFEQDVHLWMKRAWTLDSFWGTNAAHRTRVRAALLSGNGELSLATSSDRGRSLIGT
jgi:alkylation response protein AidB-like acyl-CoA dehydrogenase